MCTITVSVNLRLIWNSSYSFFINKRPAKWLWCNTEVQQQQKPFNGLFSRTTWVSQYQKGKTNLDFTGARDSEWQWHQLGHMQVCTSLQTMPVPHHSVFYRPDALPAAQPTASKHWRHTLYNWKVSLYIVLTVACQTVHAALSGLSK